ncbi:MAG: GTPase HflX, partial [Chitinivibrionales bacterium]
GIGTRGPGEKQLEVDRRLVQKKITDLKKRLSKIEKSRNTRRKNRRDVTRAVLVGYTNAGKSSLLNTLSGSKEFVENKLFATLDTATRKVYLPDAGEIVVSDTVGFIRKLPHQLVASFRSTLGVVAEADLVMIVLDVSDPNCSEQLKTVEEVLKGLGADEIPRIKILNKSDRLNDDFERKGAAIEHRDSILVSAFSKDDMDRLKGMMGDRITALIKERERKKLIEKKTRETYTFEYR